ncbi:MAG: hypothetical protein GY787_30885 [Alteromonadales bacterium]|nr:hypothetical protein [Alteromonadales bacterium]
MEIVAGIFLIIAGGLNSVAANVYWAKAEFSESGTWYKFYSGFLRATGPFFLFAACLLFGFTWLIPDTFINAVYIEYIFIIGVVTLLVEVIGGLTLKFGISNLPGLLAGGFALNIAIPTLFS